MNKYKIQELESKNQKIKSKMLERINKEK